MIDSAFGHQQGRGTHSRQRGGVGCMFSTFTARDGCVGTTAASRVAGNEPIRGKSIDLLYLAWYYSVRKASKRGVPSGYEHENAVSRRTPT